MSILWRGGAKRIAEAVAIAALTAVACRVLDYVLPPVEAQDIRKKEDDG